MVWKEDLLHFIWRYRRYQPFALKTVDGEEVKVLDAGQYNSDAGPDFLYAKVMIGTTEWIGHVEIHVQADDWYLHQHDSDLAYNNVILHVVWENHVHCRREDHSLVPTLILKNYVDEKILVQYTYLMKSSHQIPCAPHLAAVNELVKTNWLQRMSIERLESKFQNYIAGQKNIDWEKLTFKLLCRSFGMQVNKETFMKLGELVDIKLLQKYRADDTKINAILFGQAGFLEDEFQDEYYQNLKSTYLYLKSAHHLPQLYAHEWKFLRMRPYNFPTYRLAQLGSLYTHYSTLFSTLIALQTIEEVHKLFAIASIDPFWQTHYLFARTTSKHPTNWAKGIIDHLLINCFAVVVFNYGKYMQNSEYMDKSMRWIASLMAEKNKITSHFQPYGLTAQNASDSQAMVHLFNEYCEKRKCLACAIGSAILKRSN